MGLEINGGGRSSGGPPGSGLPGSGLPPGASFEDEPPIDLSLLRAATRTGHTATDWEALAARIERAAEPELARRTRAATGVLDFLPVLARSLRPALVAAAAALLLSVGLVPSQAPVEPVEVATLTADVVTGQLFSDASDERAPETSDAAWIAQQRAPSATALAEAIGLGEIP